MDSVLVGLHATAGALALVSMWVPLVAAKGGLAHRRGGRVYAASMVAVVALALVVCALRLTDTTPGNDRGAWFLAMIAVMAGDTTWFGWRTTSAGRPGPLDVGVPVAAGLAGLAGLGLGVWAGMMLPAVFGALSATLAGRQLRTLRAGEPTGRARIRAHLGAMLASCIATVTAFVVVNAGPLPVSPLVIWLAPTAVGVPVILWFSRRYR